MLFVFFTSVQCIRIKTSNDTYRTVPKRKQRWGSDRPIRLHNPNDPVLFL